MIRILYDFDERIFTPTWIFNIFPFLFHFDGNFPMTSLISLGFYLKVLIDTLTCNIQSHAGSSCFKTCEIVLLHAAVTSSSCGWASSSDGLDVDGVDFKPASGVIIQDQQTLYSFWCTM